MTPQVQETLLSFVSLLLATLLSGMLVAWLWILTRLAKGQSLLPDSPFVRFRPAQWGIGTVLAVGILYFCSGMFIADVMRPLFGVDIRSATAPAKDGLEAPGSGAPAEKTQAAGDIAPAVEVKPPAKAKDAASAPKEDAEPSPNPLGLILWNSLHNLLFLALLPWVFRKASGAELTALGLSRMDLGRQVQLGLVAGLAATPLIYAIQFAALTIYKFEAHPVEKMLAQQFDPATALLAFLSAVVLAPAAEEVLFRGVLQGSFAGALIWLQARTARSSTPMGAADVASTSADFPRSTPSTTEPEPPKAGLNPVDWTAVMMTSLLFAAVHGPQWPAPIALFAFAIILGTVYQKTGSLIAAITIHGVFNMCSTLMLLERQLLLASLTTDDGAASAPVSAAVGFARWIGRILI